MTGLASQAGRRADLRPGSPDDPALKGYIEKTHYVFEQGWITEDESALVIAHHIRLSTDSLSHEEDKRMGNVKILFLAANPNPTTRLRLDQECHDIEDKIRKSEFRDEISFISKWAVRPDDLLQFMNEHRPGIVHFSGHGGPGAIVLDGIDGKPRMVSERALLSLFKTLKDNVRVVVLNACFSKAQAEAIIEIVDCAIGMSCTIGDKAAITFAASFYRAIGFGRSVQEAFDQGKTALELEGIPDGYAIELLVRKGVDPSQVVLVEA